MTAMTMLVTCMMILCVDFPICPRRFAKTHSYGFSLMDTGTGFAVALSALAGTRAMLDLHKPANMGLMIYRSVLPLFSLGVIRTCAVCLLRYHQSPTEYGLHWNFFFTIAFVRLFSIVITANPVSKQWLKKGTHLKRASFLVCASLISLACSAYVDHAVGFNMISDRCWPSVESRSRSLFLANVEGLSSFPGYLTIYFLSSACLVIIQLLMTNAGVYGPRYCLLCVISFGLSIAFTFGLYLHLFGWRTISRRFASPSYIAFIMFISTIACLLIVFIHYVQSYFVHRLNIRTYPSSALVHSLSRNAVAYFILSNLTTGLVNTLMDTLRFLPADAQINQSTGTFPFDLWSAASQLFILFSYTVVCLFVTVLRSPKSDWLKYMRMNNMVN
ncbi:Phosphatidylinositol-glycan biosynthesis class W protein [Paragonimus heterotremus]|uniref:Phosphatidylinositol-glycan biosynthesis class W protein n=1 Tax=Paragonimus heterotremus TaxID=100268 RepID=A0A8J4SZU8_9TREM|nr:Phosphatidylinositol-glycan biosynthesis class W protein [Paragonimus heterotremus]